jgi:hypothetical protein
MGEKDTRSLPAIEEAISGKSRSGRHGDDRLCASTSNTLRPLSAAPNQLLQQWERGDQNRIRRHTTRLRNLFPASGNKSNTGNPNTGGSRPSDTNAWFHT